MIYFIRSPEGRIKIGTTIRLSQRLKQLADEYGSGLEILAVTDGDISVERALHRRFAHLRIINEWFEPGDDLLGFIVSDGKPWDGKDEAPKSINTKAYLFKSTIEWGNWLDGFAKHQRTSIASLIDRALAQHAEAVGYKEVPPSRIA